MNYRWHYQQLMHKARNRVLTGYKEIHHSRPLCIGGTESKRNKVELLPEEHYVAHQLLVKIHPHNLKLLHAAQMMTTGNHRYRNKRKGNKLYGWLRRRLSKSMSKQNVMYDQSVREYHKRRVNESQTKELCEFRSARMLKKNPMKSLKLRKRQSALMKKRMKDPLFKTKMMRNVPWRIK